MSSVNRRDIVIEIRDDHSDGEFVAKSGYNEFTYYGTNNITEITNRLLPLCEEGPFIPTQTYTPADYQVRQEKIFKIVTDLTRIKAVQEILSATESSGQSIMDIRTADDLRMLHCRGLDDPLVSKLDRTSTQLGREFLYERVTNPVDTIATILDRQDLAKAFSSEGYSTLVDALERELASLAENEPHLLSTYNRSMALPGRVDKLKIKYGTRFDRTANTYPTLVTINALGETAKSITSAAIQTATVIAMPLYILSMSGMFREENREQLEAYADRTMFASGPLYGAAQAIPSEALHVFTALSAASFAALGLETNCKYIVADLNVEAILQHKMLSVSHFYRSMKRTHELLSAHPGLAGKLEHFAKLDKFMNNPDLQNLFNVFESRTFNAEANYFFCRGPVLVAWEEMQKKEVKDKFKEALTAIAEIDALLSASKLIKETCDDGGVKYCFPQFVNSDSPIVQLNRYWNPMLDRQVAVPNNIAFGHLDIPNIVVTGPNAGGKSTSLRAITSTIAMAQSLGIAPAESMSLCLYNRIVSSMQTTDRIGQSLFQAQVSLADEITTEVQKFPNKHFFIVLDELFNGTTAEDGAALAKGTMQTLQKCKNCTVLFATHFSDLTELEAEGNRVVNFRVTVDENMRSHYHLKPGISDQRVAFDVARQMNLNQEVFDHAMAAKEKKVNYNSK